MSTLTLAKSGSSVHDERKQKLGSLIRKNIREYSVSTGGVVTEVDREFASKRTMRQLEAKQRL